MDEIIYQGEETNQLLENYVTQENVAKLVKEKTRHCGGGFAGFMLDQIETPHSFIFADKCDLETKTLTFEAIYNIDVETHSTIKNPQCILALEGKKFIQELYDAYAKIGKTPPPLIKRYTHLHSGGGSGKKVYRGKLHVILQQDSEGSLTSIVQGYDRFFESKIKEEKSIYIKSSILDNTRYTMW